MSPPVAHLQRRGLLGAGLSLAVLLQGLAGCAPTKARAFPGLRPDPRGLCDLPPGFAYKVISAHGETLSDGHAVPDYHDGMGCFAAPAGACVLVRNHEVPLYFPFDPPSPVPALAYDPEASGGTTTIWLDRSLRVQRHTLSLSGTIRNCGGGSTPWGTWISCEEASPDGWQMGQRHGYNFEVDPRQPLRRILPLRAMGRFNHEAVAVDPRSGIVYQTEDASDGCFYRFLPRLPGRLADGGRLQALKFVDSAIRHSSRDGLQSGLAYDCTWVDIDEPDPEQDTVRLQAQERGAAVFVRGEGIALQADGIYFACTTGGSAGLGQIFRFRPGVDDAGGQLELVYSAAPDGPLANPDNLVVAPWGDLLICEDSRLGANCLAGLRADGEIYAIAANRQSEWCGACFSPDGLTLFANIHKKPGMTLAIRGPWAALRAGQPGRSG